MSTIRLYKMVLMYVIYGSPSVTFLALAYSRLKTFRAVSSAQTHVEHFDVM